MTRLVSPEKCQRAKLLSRVHPDRTVAELVGISRNTLHFLKKRGFEPRHHFRRNRPRPSDYAIQRKYMKREELCAHYRTSARCIIRWDRELREAANSSAMAAGI